MSLEEIKQMTDDVEGWLLDSEGELLYHFAKNCQRSGVIVEIGSWKGRSTIWLGTGSKEGNRVSIYAIDPHTGSPEHRKRYGKVSTVDDFKKNIKMARVDDLVTLIVKTSEEAARDFRDPVSFIFIDGAHEYEAAKLDFDLWFPKIVNGGVMAFHDTILWSGPKRVVTNHLYKSKYFKNVRFVGSVTAGEKVEQNSLRDRVKNRYVLLLKHGYEFSHKISLPKPIRIIGRKIVNLLQ